MVAYCISIKRIAADESATTAYYYLMSAAF